MRVFTALFVAMSVALAGAQSLGDVARREAERRKTVKAPGKTYTNDQLKADGRDVPSVPAQGPASAPQTATPAGGAPAPSTSSGSAKADGDPAAKAGTAPAPGAVPKDEASWRARIQSTREALSRAQIFADALQSRINGLSADFTARDDPAQRAAVAADRQKSLDELERVKKEIQQHTKTLSDIQEEGRKAGVPSGWLR